MRISPPMGIPVAAALAVLIAVFSFGTAQAQGDPSAEITEFGLYSAGPITSSDPPSDYGVPREYGDYITLLESTHEIPGQMNLSFGFRYKLHSGTGPAVLPITIVVRYPPQGLYNPELGYTSDHDEWTFLAPTDVESFYTWDFFAPWRIEPGRWNVEIWSGDTKLGEQWFDVITPPVS